MPETIRITQCTICFKGTVLRWPSGWLQCDACMAIGDPVVGLMWPADFPVAERPAIAEPPDDGQQEPRR